MKRIFIEALIKNVDKIENDSDKIYKLEMC